MKAFILVLNVLVLFNTSTAWADDDGPGHKMPAWQYEQLKQRYGEGRAKEMMDRIRMESGNKIYSSGDDAASSSHGSNGVENLGRKDVAGQIDDIISVAKKQMGDVEKDSDRVGLRGLLQGIQDKLTQTSSEEGAEVKSLEEALDLMKQLPRANLTEFKDDLTSLSNYPEGTSVKTKSMGLLRFLNDPRGQEQKDAKFIPAAGQIKRATGEQKQRDATPLKEILAAAEALKVVRNECSVKRDSARALYDRITSEINKTETDHSGNLTRLQKEVERLEQERPYKEAAFLKESAKKGMWNISHPKAKDALSLLIEGQMSDGTSDAQVGPAIGRAILGFILSNTEAVIPLNITGAPKVKTFKAIGEKEVWYQQDLGLITDRFAMVELNPNKVGSQTSGVAAVKEVLFKMDPSLGNRGFTPTRIAANAMDVIDKIWNNTVQDLKECHESAAFKQYEKELADAKEAVKKTTSEFPAAIARLHADRDAVKGCIDTYKEVENVGRVEDSSAGLNKLSERYSHAHKSIEKVENDLGGKYPDPNKSSHSGSPDADKSSHNGIQGMGPGGMGPLNPMMQQPQQQPSQQEDIAEVLKAAIGR